MRIKVYSLDHFVLKIRPPLTHIERTAKIIRNLQNSWSESQPAPRRFKIMGRNGFFIKALDFNSVPALEPYHSISQCGDPISPEICFQFYHSSFVYLTLTNNKARPMRKLRGALQNL